MRLPIAQITQRAGSSVGRARESHSRGQGFDSPPVQLSFRVEPQGGAGEAVPRATAEGRRFKERNNKGNHRGSPYGVRRSRTTVDSPPVHGFTLVELLVVVVIIGLLATLAFGGLQRAVEKGREKEARLMLGTLYQAEEIYYTEHKTYTDDANELDTTSVPNDNSVDHFYKYRVVSADSNGFLLEAIRKTGTDIGKDPLGETAYTVTLDETGRYSVNYP